MKQSFVMVGEGETKIKFTANIETTKYTLTRGELSKLKKELQDELHGVLMRNGYYAVDIKMRNQRRKR